MPRPMYDDKPDRWGCAMTILASAALWGMLAVLVAACAGCGGAA